MAFINSTLLLAPITEGSPAGEDARYEFCYEMMEAEIKKFGSLFDETVNWSVVKEHATEVLAHHSKDIKALCYLTRALLHEGQLDGLEEGLRLLDTSLCQFGADLYPRRKRGRDGAIEWLAHQLKLAIPKLDQVSWDALSRCNDVIGEIQQHLDAAFEDTDADFFELRAELNTLMQRVGLEVQDTASPAPEVATNQDTRLSETPTTSATQTPEPAKKQSVASAKPKPTTAVKTVDVDTDFSSPAASRKTLRNVAETLINASPSLPLSYRVYRYMTWQDIDGLPDHQHNQTPLVLAVSQDQQAEYNEKSKQAGDIETIKRLERTLTDAPFWLTGHHLVHMMLNHLGYHDAAKAVKEEVCAFVEKFPGIEQLLFKHSIPFADESTQAWLSSGVAGSSIAQPAMQSLVMSEDTLQMEDVTLSNFGECVADIAKKLELDRSGRGQFLLHLQMVKAYHSVDLFSLSLPYLEKIWVTAEEMDLLYWEPHLALQLESLSGSALKALYPTKDQLPAKYKSWEKLYN